MSDLAPLLEGFFSDRLLRQRQASRNTMIAYRDTFKLCVYPGTADIQDKGP